MQLKEKFGWENKQLRSISIIKICYDSERLYGWSRICYKKKKKTPFQKPKIFPKFGKIFIEFTIFVPSLEKSLTVPLTKIVTMF